MTPKMTPKLPPPDRSCEGVDRDPLGTPDSHVMPCNMQRVTQHATCHRNMQRVIATCNVSRNHARMSSTHPDWGKHYTLWVMS